MSLIGLDIGTTGCKAIVFDKSGNILKQAAREYAVLFPHPNWAEQDAEQVFALAMDALTEAVNGLADAPVAMALSCQGEAVIPVDANGRALRHAILGMDTRTTDTINTLPKLLWFQRHESDVWQAAQQFLLYEDFFIRRFTGKAFASHCLASRTQMYDLKAGDWADDILESCHIERSRLAELAPKDGLCGNVQSKMAEKIGLPKDLKIFAGGHDQACAALGSGVVQAGLAMVSTGTAEVVEVALDSPILHPTLREGNISIYRHVVPELYLAMTLNHSGGLSLRWFRDTFGQWEKEQAEANQTDAYEILLQGVREEPTDLLVLPHFSGAGTPILDTQSKGAILGLTFSTTKADVAKAILEGLCFELRLNIELLRNAGISIDQIYAVGGGAKSPLWLQLKADICKLSLRVPQSTESACRGAAMLAGVGAGVFEDIRDAANQWVDYRSTYEADETQSNMYDDRYSLYQKLYPALKYVHHKL